jgi:predicted RNase H-like nuclease (RuvC/YqgF family)
MAHLRAINQHPQSRITELEAEVRRLTIENTKIKADLEKAQRRWEKLKEGARRRRPRDGAGTATPASNDGGTPSIPESAEEGKE